MKVLLLVGRDMPASSGLNWQISTFWRLVKQFQIENDSAEKLLANLSNCFKQAVKSLANKIFSVLELIF